MIWPKGWSLQRRIYGVAATAIVAAGVTGGIALYSTAAREYERMRADNLANLARTVLVFCEHELREVLSDVTHGTAIMTPPVHTETATTLGERYAYQIWSKGGELLVRSVRAPDNEQLAPSGQPGLHSVDGANGRRRSVYVLRSEAADIDIHVADFGDEGLAVSSSFFREVVLASVVALLPVLFLTWMLMRNAFAALRRTARELQTRGVTNFAPLEVHSPPIELLPVIGAVNVLLPAVGQALERERGFTALAAHELRRPLASIRVQAQVVARATDSEERVKGAQDLAQNVDRCERLVTQLLTLARTDELSTRHLVAQPVRIDETCAEVLSDFADLAARRNISLACDLRVDEVVADPVALQTLLRNLVSNAMTYTPDNGAVLITAEPEPGGVMLSVDDSGVGIPEGERRRVLERFYRGSGHSGMGVGLGLSIVDSIAKAHRAVVKLGDSACGGLRVEVRFAGARSPI